MSSLRATSTAVVLLMKELMGGVDRLPGRDVGSPKRRHLVPKIDTKIDRCYLPFRRDGVVPGSIQRP